MKKVTIRDVEIEFDDTVDVEISGDKIIVKGKNLPLPTSYPVYIPYPSTPVPYTPLHEPFKITWSQPAIITCGQDFSGTNPCPPMLTDGKTYVL